MNREPPTFQREDIWWGLGLIAFVAILAMAAIGTAKTLGWMA